MQALRFAETGESCFLDLAKNQSDLGFVVVPWWDVFFKTRVEFISSPVPSPLFFSFSLLPTRRPAILEHSRRSQISRRCSVPAFLPRVQPTRSPIPVPCVIFAVIPCCQDGLVVTGPSPISRRRSDLFVAKNDGWLFGAMHVVLL